MFQAETRSSGRHLRRRERVFLEPEHRGALLGDECDSAAFLPFLISAVVIVAGGQRSVVVACLCLTSSISWCSADDRTQR